MTVILPGKSACFECLFPGGRTDPSPRTIGAIGAVVGIVASLQCTEALKLILGTGLPMSDRMLIIRADRGEWKFTQTRRNPDCTLCALV